MWIISIRHRTAHLQKQILEVLELVLGMSLLNVSSDLERTINENCDVLEVLLQKATAAMQNLINPQP